MKKQEKGRSGGSSGSVAEVKVKVKEEGKEEKPAEEEYELKPYRLIPWIIPKRDGRHEMILTRLPIDAYFFHAVDYVTIYLKLIKTAVNVIDTTLVGTYPDLSVNPENKGEIIRISRPVTLAMLSKEEVRAVTQNLSLPEVTKEILDKSVEAFEGFLLLDSKYDIEYTKREAASALKMLSKRDKTGVEISDERVKNLMDAFRKAKLSMVTVSAGDKIRSVIDSFKFRILVAGLFILGLIYWLGWFF